jgi:glycosidase
MLCFKLPTKPGRRSTPWIALLVLLCQLTPTLAADWPPAPPLHVAPDDMPGPLPPSIRAETLAEGRWRCTFHFKPDAGAQTVALAGTFNNWSRDAVRLSGPDANGLWSGPPGADGVWWGPLELRAGIHEYKFVVDGAHWFRDPHNPDGVNDNNNGQNSVLRLGRIANLKSSAGRVGDGQIEGLALLHNPQSPLYCQVLPEGKLLVRLRTLAHDVEQVSVALQSGPSVAMSVVDEGPLFALWEGIAPLAAATDYTFLLADGTLRATDPQTYGVSMPKELFRTPDWAKQAVWYQIFPERFRNGDPSNDRQPVRPWTSEWFTPSPWETQSGQAFYKYFVFDRQYGGDFAGIEEKLPYLKDLGVSALYLNPIFQAEGNHKYNATNFVHVDEHFGVVGDYESAAAREDLNDPRTWQWTPSDRRFLRMLRKAHELGLKVVLDGVFNHVGTQHPAFQDVKKNGKNSKYADWFNITSWEPFRWEGWAGVDSLPVFKKSATGFASDAVKQHIFNVTRRWMDPDSDGDPRDGIDGWRLDVPNEVPAPFWAEWRQVVKSVNPDAYIVGEIWNRAELWLDGRQFDAVMNYPFARACVAWVFNHKLKITASELDRRLRELRLAYPQEATLVLQNLLDSHDTDRLASMAHNPDRKYDDGNRAQDNGPNYDNSKPAPQDYARARLAALIPMTYVGAPMVYYGDEVGMWGADDPTCRKPMLWEDLQPYEQPDENLVMTDQLAYYRQIIALRNAHPALRTGDFRTLLTDDGADVWAFLRRDSQEQLVVVLNASDAEREVSVPLPGDAPRAWRGAFNLTGDVTAFQGKLAVKVPAVSGLVLVGATSR